MRMYHERKQREAGHVADVLRQVYGLEPEVIEGRFDSSCVELQLEGGKRKAFDTDKLVQQVRPRKVCGSEEGELIMILTERDLYIQDLSTTIDDWAFGYREGPLHVVSTARLRGADSEMAAGLEVPDELYLDRIACLAVHEVGHTLIDPWHHVPTEWRKIEGGKVVQRLSLGLHCPDIRCAMYGIADIRVKPGEVTLVGGETRTDGGLDDLLERRHEKWLCEKCDSGASKGKDV